jgi:hypothetical protein
MMQKQNETSTWPQKFSKEFDPDFFGQQGAEDDGNLQQVVESERKAGRKKMGQIPKNFCGKVLAR